MTDDEFRQLGIEAACDDTFAQSLAITIGVEHELRDTPACTAQLSRYNDNGETHYTETFWANGYPRIRMVVLTFPSVKLPVGEMSGVVKEIPVGHRDMASPELFEAAFERVLASYEDMGWKRVA